MLEGQFPTGSCPFPLSAAVEFAEWWDGNGGQMEGTSRKQVTAKKPKAAKPVKEEALVAGSVEQPVVEEGLKKKTTGSAMENLRRAAGDSVREQSKEIAQSLVDNTMKGNATCAKLLLDLVEKELGTEKKPNNGQSLASEMAAEEQWTGKEGSS